MWGCTYEGVQCLWKVEALDSPRAGVTGCFNSPNVGTWNQTQALCKSSSSLPSHLASPSSSTFDVFQKEGTQNCYSKKAAWFFCLFVFIFVFLMPCPDCARTWMFDIYLTVLWLFHFCAFHRLYFSTSALPVIGNIAFFLLLWPAFFLSVTEEELYFSTSGLQ